MFVYVVMRIARAKLIHDCQSRRRNDWNWRIRRWFNSGQLGVTVMGPALFVIAILGCGEAEAPCRQVATADARYASRAACAAAAPAAIEQHIDAAYPVVVAECRPAG